jgi:hypothetical protein
MHKALIAQRLLSLTSRCDRAETMAGDLAEEARARGSLWFAAALTGVCLAMFFQAFGAARARTLRVLGLGLVVWLAAYAAARGAGALLGLHPLVIDGRSVAELPTATVLYLGATLVLANFLTGLVLGRRASLNGMSPVMPLAVFWASTAVVAFCSDVAAGTPTWYCTLVYLGGLPVLYIAPLLSGALLAGHTTAPVRLGVSQ